MVLWALREYREWSLRLAQPALLPFAAGFCGLISNNRQALSGWLGNASDHALRTHLEQAQSSAMCDGLQRAVEAKR
jgi:hypothetical protein